MVLEEGGSEVVERTGGGKDGTGNGREGCREVVLAIEMGGEGVVDDVEKVFNVRRAGEMGRSEAIMGPGFSEVTRIADAVKAAKVRVWESGSKEEKEGLEILASAR